MSAEGASVIAARAMPTSVALDRLVAIARRADPALDIREIRITPDNGVIFLGQSSAWLVRDRANAVVVDPAMSRVVARLDGRALRAHQRLSEMADPLHFGTFGGLWTKAVWFLFGALLTAMAVTGTMICAMRLARSSRSNAGSMKIAWQGMGAWGYIGIALILLTLILTPGAIGGAS
ncbi:PepSY domain-containing protein [Sphingobium sp. LMA1-1-1.1]